MFACFRISGWPSILWDGCDCDALPELHKSHEVPCSPFPRNDIFLIQEASLVGREAKPIHLRERVLLDMRVTYLRLPDQRMFWPKHNGVMTLEDPGWWPSLRGLWWYAIPVVGPVMRVRARRREMNGLIVLRSVFLGLVAPPLLFIVALSFIGPWDGGDEGWVPWAVVAIGIASLAYVARIRRRPLPTTSLEALARSYRALFFIGVGVASAAALWGFVGVFLGGSLWIYLVGLAFGLVGLLMIAPTRTDVERRQREITAVGSPLSLLDALISVPRP